MTQKYNNHKEWLKGWRYEKDAPYDKEWKKDRDEFFAKNGNGWWWYITDNKVFKRIRR